MLASAAHIPDEVPHCQRQRRTGHEVAVHSRMLAALCDVAGPSWAALRGAPADAHCTVQVRLDLGEQAVLAPLLP